MSNCLSLLESWPYRAATKNEFRQFHVRARRRHRNSNKWSIEIFAGWWGEGTYGNIWNSSAEITVLIPDRTACLLLSAAAESKYPLSRLPPDHPIHDRLAEYPPCPEYQFFAALAQEWKDTHTKTSATF